MIQWANRSPLHLTAQVRHDVIVSDLLEREANPNEKTWAIWDTPLHLAAVGGRVLRVSKLLLSGADKNSRNKNGDTPLYLAARRGRLGVAEELLTANADPNIRAGGGQTPLDIAATWGNAGVLRAFLRHGGDSNARESWNDLTVLHIAVEYDRAGRDNSDAVRVLLEAGADVEAKTTHNGHYTALHLATRRRWSSSGTMRVLLEERADVNARGEDACTALHYCTLAGSPTWAVSSFCYAGEQTRRS